MGDNTKRYGFRWSTAANGRGCPNPISKVVASGYQGAADAAAGDVDLRIGDLVKLVAGGTVALANTTEAVFGVIVGFEPYYNAAKGVMEPTNRLPGASAWSGEARAAKAKVVPVDGAALWEADCDDQATAVTEAAYRALEGKNAQFVCPGVNLGGVNPSADPRIDISTQATTAGHGLRLVKLSPTMENQDFTGLNVKFLVQFNKIQAAGAAATTIAGV